jgi:predicted nucleotidyltransferase
LTGHDPSCRSPELTTQLEDLVEVLTRAPGASLLGVYVHGSLALGCFKPERSDIDVLAVAARPVTAGERQLLGDELRRISAPKASPRAGRWPFELDVLTPAHIDPWRHHARYVFDSGRLRASVDWMEPGLPAAR